MAEVWKSRDLSVELGASSTAGVYNLTIKSPREEILSNSISRLVERSFGVTKEPYETDRGSTVYDQYYETFKETIPDVDSDFCLHGYFASWSKKTSFDKDSGSNIISRNWVLNKIFKLKNLGTGTPDAPNDRGILTTGGFKFYKDPEYNTPCIMLYNSDDGELFDYILNASERNSIISFYGKKGILYVNIYDSFLSDIWINNRDFIQGKLDVGYRLGIFGHYTKGATTMTIESTVLPDGLPDKITGYDSLKSYAFDQLSKYQIYESYVDDIYVALYQKVDGNWTRVEEEVPQNWFINITRSCGYICYAEYGSSSAKSGSDIPSDFFNDDLEIRMCPFSGYPQFMIGDRTLVRFKERITPFSSLVPYDELVVDNYERISDIAVQFDVTIRGLSVSELDVATSFDSTVKSKEIRSFRSNLRQTNIEKERVTSDYGEGEHPYTEDLDPETGDRRNRKIVYLESDEDSRIYGGWSLRSDWHDRVDMPKMVINIPMSSDTISYPYVKKITLIAPYQEHLTGGVNITRNGEVVGSTDIDQLDYKSTFTYERINNDVDVDASYSIITTREEDEVPRAYFDTTNATLKARFYDHTRIKFSDNSGMEIDPAEALKNMTINVTECLGANRKSVTFNMATRKILIDGVETGETCDDFIFYDTFLTYNTETQQYEMSIYIPAKCSITGSVKGFNDSIVTVTYKSVKDGEELGTSTLKYRTVLPPFILQGVPKKKTASDADPVFPNEANRPDIGYDPDSDTYVIQSYSENSQNYNRDFFFTNGDPLYVIETSGFMPSDFYSYYKFGDADAFLVNDKTESKMVLNQDGPVRSNIAMPVILIHEGQEWKASYEISTWTHLVESMDNGFYKNVATVSAAVVEKV